MELTMHKITVSLTLLFVVLCTVDAVNYLAFPRMGRSQGNAVTSPDQGDECCGVGIKSEFSIAEDGKEEMRSLCSASQSVCCRGLREVAEEKPDGTIYSMCLPDILNMYPSSLNKLKSILSK